MHQKPWWPEVSQRKEVRKKGALPDQNQRAARSVKPSAGIAKKFDISRNIAGKGSNWKINVLKTFKYSETFVPSFIRILYNFIFK